MKLAQLLRDQRDELEDGLSGKKIIKREAGDFFHNIISSKLIKVVSGVRRCGKSVFTYLLLKDRNFAYMNFDDERLSDFNSSQILPSFYEIYGKDFKFIFLDEIQNLKNWELFANRLHRAGFNLFITGSNSKLLSRELATSLTGRHLTMELFPFSFREYLKAVNFQEDIKTTRGQSILRSELKNFLSSGGFPEIVVEKENVQIYMRELYRKIVERDIIDRHDISYKKTFREIAMSLISNPGRYVSFNKIKRQFGLGSEHTVKNYVSYLEEAYLIFMLNRFSYKPVEIEKSEKKVYVIDTGIINGVSLRFTRDHGRIYENAVAIELLRRKAFNPDIEIFYWKSPQHEEVDFVLKGRQKVAHLIQVCYDVDDYDTKEREIKALLKASKELKCKNLLIITEDYEGEEVVKGKRIRFSPLWKWLLE